MLLPISAIVTLLGSVASGDLNLVIPRGSTFNGKPITDINANVSRNPKSLANLNLGEVGRWFFAHANHSICINIWNAIRVRCCTTIHLIGATIPPPKNRFNQAHAIETKGVIRCSANHSGSAGGFIITVVVTISVLVCFREGRTNAPHHIKRFIILCNVSKFCYKFFVVHQHSSLIRFVVSFKIVQSTINTF